MSFRSSALSTVKFLSLVITARCTIVQSAVLRSHVVCLFVCPSVTLVDHDHIGWKSWKLIAWTISPTSSLFVAQRSSTYFQGNMEKFWGENVRSTPTSITSGWIQLTESYVLLGGRVAVCLLLSAHRAVIFAIAQLSCFEIAFAFLSWVDHTEMSMNRKKRIKCAKMHFLIIITGERTSFPRPHPTRPLAALCKSLSNYSSA